MRTEPPTKFISEKRAVAVLAIRINSHVADEREVGGRRDRYFSQWL